MMLNVAQLAHEYLELTQAARGGMIVFTALVGMFLAVPACHRSTNCCWGSSASRLPPPAPPPAIIC